MNNSILILVFSSAILFFMIFPSVLVTQWLTQKYPLFQKYRNIITILLVIIFSLIAGILLAK
jgi:hypothetical protein